MKRELRNEWVRRLRSGDWAQAQGRLTDGIGGYCCLGVLCEIGVERGRVEHAPVSLSYRTGDYNDATEVLIPSVWAEEIGMVFDLPEHPDVVVDGLLFDSWDDYDAQGALASLNDSGADFDQIADVIERIIPVED